MNPERAMLEAIAFCESVTQPLALAAASEVSVDQIIAHAATKFGVDASALRSAWIRKLLAVSAARAGRVRREASAIEGSAAQQHRRLTTVQTGIMYTLREAGEALTVAEIGQAIERSASNTRYPLRLLIDAGRVVEVAGSSPATYALAEGERD